MSEQIPFASDHAGYELKNKIIKILKEKGVECIDKGPFSDESVDYPDFIHPVSAAIDKGEYKFAVILCGSGQGASMVANKYQNVRAALCWNAEQSTLSRKHNDANIISIPARFIEVEEAVNAIENFLRTEFEGGRHERRVNKILIN
ncbi:MAG: ribose 5-phosphate isomerase B [Bacteroidales bacterium]|nr:ribose 5-phosphate isomerase B [Bacteroidales bacterium]